MRTLLAGIITYAENYTHRVAVTASQWAKVEEGEVVSTPGSFAGSEGNIHNSQWTFNPAGLGSVRVTSLKTEDVFEMPRWTELKIFWFTQSSYESLPRTSYPDINYRFTPVSYWNNANLSDYICGDIQGTVRRCIVAKALREGKLEKLPSSLLKGRLDENVRKFWGRIHPSLIGGEYLPPCKEGEVTIATISYGGSVTGDIEEIRASPDGSYRFMGEHGEDTELDEGDPDFYKPFRKRRYSSPEPLSQIVSWIEECSPLYDALTENYSFGEPGSDLSDFVCVDSSFYPELGSHFGRRIRKHLSSLED